MTPKRLTGEIKTVPISYPKRHPDNSRKGDIEAVAESIRENREDGSLPWTEAVTEAKAEFDAGLERMAATRGEQP